MTDSRNAPAADDIKPFVIMTKDQWNRMDDLTDGELNRWADRMEQLVNEQPCGCHDDPKYGHVVMCECPLHD